MDRFGVTSALITYPSVNPRGALFDPARWALVYQSNEALLFARRTAGRQQELAELELPLTFRYDATNGLTPEAMPQPPPGATTRACDWSLRIGDFFLMTDKPARARDAYRDAGDCLDRERRRTLAGLEMQLGDTGAAARLLDDDTDPRSRLQHGYALLRLGNAQRALDDFDDVLMKSRPGDPLNADATLGRALALEALHRDAEALAAFRDLLARAPNHVGAADARAHIARLTSR
jgi:tetratricopeptide (TPR) repeat protein